MVVWDAWTLPRVPRNPFTVVLDSRSDPLGLINIVAKFAGLPSAGNPHATRNVAGAKNGAAGYRTSSRPYRARESSLLQNCVPKESPILAVCVAHADTDSEGLRRKRNSLA